MKLNDYTCNNCQTVSELLLTSEEQPVCPACSSTDMTVCLSGTHRFIRIVPTHPATRQSKAGYVHEYENKPAEKISVTVPRSFKP